MEKKKRTFKTQGKKHFEKKILSNAYQTKWHQNKHKMTTIPRQNMFVSKRRKKNLKKYDAKI